MASNKARLQRPVHLVLDFDSTLTVRDTLSLLRAVPTGRNARLDRDIEVPEWSYLEDAYIEDYKRHKETETKDRDDLASQPRPFAEKATLYSQMLSRRKVLEERSAMRVEDCDFFSGVTRTDVRKAAEGVVWDRRLEVRKPWTDMLQMFIPTASNEVATQRSKVSIISINWSAAFIRQSLLSSLAMEGLRDTDLAGLVENKMAIYSNEISGLDAPDGSEGRMDMKILSNIDKLKYLPVASEREDILGAGRLSNQNVPKLVYVGDSSTDFDCLMAADMGIWLCPVDDLEEARKACEKCFNPLQLKIRPIEEAHEKRRGDDEVVWAQNFEQITEFLSKLAP